jgi:hypothetical protein
MPTPTYTPLATITLGSAAASVTFGSIPATYRDLILVLQGLANTSILSATMRLNGDTGSNYSYVFMTGTGSVAQSSAATDTRINVAAISASSMSQTIFQLQDYSATDKHKALLIRTDVAGWGTRAGAARWANTSAVTSISIIIDGGSLTTGSTLSLYGVIA